jgi:hypothetical protein
MIFPWTETMAALIPEVPWSMANIYFFGVSIGCIVIPIEPFAEFNVVQFR